MKRRHTMTKRKKRRKRKEKRMARITANQKRTHASSMLPVWPSGPPGEAVSQYGNYVNQPTGVG